jgi:hypothetical protein
MSSQREINSVSDCCTATGAGAEAPNYQAIFGIYFKQTPREPILMSAEELSTLDERHPDTAVYDNEHEIIIAAPKVRKTASSKSRIASAANAAAASREEKIFRKLTSRELSSATRKAQNKINKIFSTAVTLTTLNMEADEDDDGDMTTTTTTTTTGLLSNTTKPTKQMLRLRSIRQRRRTNYKSEQCYA